MYCSTCGARVPDGHTRCDNCGAPVSRPAGFGVPAVAHAAPGMPVSAVAVTCPRCGYQGPTVGYFSQGGHVAWLLVLTLATIFPTMGAGGLLYYLIRHNHRSCARCGYTLGRGSDLALQASAAGGTPLTPAAAAEADLPEDVGTWSSLWGIGAILLFLFAGFLTLVALEDGPEPLVFAGFAAGAGALLMKKARNAREERRQALLIALQQPVLRLAGECQGRLTVTQVASSLGWPLRRAEKVLNSLEDGLRVASDVTSEGVIVYEFRELMHARRAVTAEEMDALLIPGEQGQTQAQRTQAQPLPLPRDGTLSA